MLGVYLNAVERNRRAFVGQVHLQRAVRRRRHARDRPVGHHRARPSAGWWRRSAMVAVNVWAVRDAARRRAAAGRRRADASGAASKSSPKTAATPVDAAAPPTA